MSGQGRRGPPPGYGMQQQPQQPQQQPQQQGQGQMHGMQGGDFGGMGGAAGPPGAFAPLQPPQYPPQGQMYGGAFSTAPHAHPPPQQQPLFQQLPPQQQQQPPSHGQQHQIPSPLQQQHGHPQQQQPRQQQQQQQQAPLEPWQMVSGPGDLGAAGSQEPWQQVPADLGAGMLGAPAPGVKGPGGSIEGLGGIGGLTGLGGLGGGGMWSGGSAATVGSGADGAGPPVPGMPPPGMDGGGADASQGLKNLLGLGAGAPPVPATSGPPPGLGLGPGVGMGSCAPGGLDSIFAGLQLGGGGAPAHQHTLLGQRHAHPAQGQGQGPPPQRAHLQQRPPQHPPQHFGAPPSPQPPLPPQQAPQPRHMPQAPPPQHAPRPLQQAPPPPPGQPQADGERRHTDAERSRKARHEEGKRRKKNFGDAIEPSRVVRLADPLPLKLLPADQANARHRRSELRVHADLERVDSELLALVSSLRPSEEEVTARNDLFARLSELFRLRYPDSVLHLFGSAANGFATQSFDLDLALEQRGPEHRPPDELCEEVGEMLEAEGMLDVKAIPHARIPVVKFVDKDTGIDCDVCFDNMLAVANTKLLRDYAAIDPRVGQLVIVVKHWAKQRNCCSAYEGTLSSYAYVLSCLYVLQTRRQPVLPALQQLSPTFRRTVDGWRCDYCDDVVRLREAQAASGRRNTESIAELLFAFFAYWQERHDWNSAVVSPRLGKLVTKSSKGWTRRVGTERHLICIEDPFNTSHDLGRVVDRNTLPFLKRELRRAYNILQSERDPLPLLFEKNTRMPEREHHKPRSRGTSVENNNAGRGAGEMPLPSPPDAPGLWPGLS